MSRKRIASAQLDTFESLCKPGQSVTFFWLIRDAFRMQWLNIRGHDLGRIVITSIRAGVREQLAEPWRVSTQPRWLDGCPCTLLPHEDLSIEVTNESHQPVQVTVSAFGLVVEPRDP